MKHLENLLEWAFAHPILALTLVYAFACAIDLFAPVGTNRGSWWNIAFWTLRLICGV